MKISDIDIDRLGIVHYPDPTLRKVCAEISEFGPELRALADRMLEIMIAGKGIGLAGPQVGIPLRMFVCNVTGETEDNLVCINPRLSEFSGGEELGEGCLSLPDVVVHVRRPKAATLTAFDVDGKQYTRRADDLWARVWQHENDHLDGRMIIDNMSTESELANRRILKKLEATYQRQNPRRKAASAG
jgi:peptide deformylase